MLWVRAIVEKLQPTSTPGQRPGSIVGRVTDAEGKPAAEAKATLVGLPNLTAVADQDGWLVVNGVPPGDWAVEVWDQAAKGCALVRVNAKPDQASHLAVTLPKAA